MSSAETPETLDIENLEEYSEEEIEAYNERKKAELRERTEEHERKRREEHREALDALKDPEEHTETVRSGNVDLEVKTYINEKVRQQFNKLTESRNEEDTRLELMPEILAWFVESPEEYTDPAIWRAYADEYGQLELAIIFQRALEPMMERNNLDEVVRGFLDGPDRIDVPPDEQPTRGADQ